MEVHKKEQEVKSSTSTLRKEIVAAEAVEDELKGNRALREKLGESLLKGASRTPLERNPPPPHDPTKPTLKAVNQRAVDRAGMIPKKVAGPTLTTDNAQDKTEKDLKLEEFPAMTAKYPHMSAEFLLAFQREQNNPQQQETATINSAKGYSPRHQRGRSALNEGDTHSQQ